MKMTCAASVILSLIFVPSLLEAQPIDRASQVGVPATPNADSVSRGAPGDWKLGESIRSQWVALDEDNTLRGRIVTLDNVTGALQSAADLRVRLYQSSDGEVSWKDGKFTGDNGEFQVEDLAGGVYQLIAFGENGFLAFSLILFERGGNPAVNAFRDDALRLVQAPADIKTRFDVVAAAIPPSFTSLNLVLAERFPEMVRSDLAPADHLASIQESDSPDGPVEKWGVPELGQNQPAADESIPATTLRSHAVPLSNDNRIRGRLFAMDPKDGHPILVENVYIYILRDDRIVFGPESVIRGEFSAYLRDGEGAYSIVAIGENGFGATSFYAKAVADEEEALRMMGEETSFVSLRLAEVDDDPELLPPRPNANRAAAYPFAMALINDPKVLQDALPQIMAPAGIAAQPLPPPAAGPAPAGAPGGGTAGGGGGLGWLLGGAGLATGITALATDRDGSTTVVQQPPMASPFVP